MREVGAGAVCDPSAEKPATPERTYGYYRAGNSGGAGQRRCAHWDLGLIFVKPTRASANAAFCCQANPYFGHRGAGIGGQRRGLTDSARWSRDSLNMQEPTSELLSDALTSVGVLVAAGIMGNRVVLRRSVDLRGYGLFILPRTWMLLREAVASCPKEPLRMSNLAALRTALRRRSLGVAAVHDLHVWH